MSSIDYDIQGSGDLESTPLEKLRHSAAHVMADAVKRLFPDAKLSIGPATDTGFYYDFDVATPFAEEDLAKIESEMANIVKSDLPFRREEVSRNEAVSLFQSRGEKYKVEILSSIPEDQKITIYRHGEFLDLCRGPHVERTSQIKAFKLLSVAGSYFRGDSKNKMLSRVYGTAFPSKEELDAYLYQIEEAKRRDHRKLGKELDLFHFEPLSPGAAFWLPKGTTLWNTLSSWIRGVYTRHGTVEVRTPLVYNKRLWEMSGHWAAYQENMFLIHAEEQVFGLKPMNCPAHHLIFGSKKRSYRELPLRLHDQSVLHRNEASGTLGGLTRVRQFCQDDSHLYITEDQIASEMQSLLQLVDQVYKVFDLKYELKLSTRDPKKMLGDTQLWDLAETALRKILNESGAPYRIEPGEGAFYGPKVDFDVTDAIGRKWQCATLQLDFQQPRRCGLSYIGSDGAEHIPVVIHRAIFGSFERFIALLIEHYAGAFPLWLAPVQAKVLGVSQKHDEFVREIESRLRQDGIRVEADITEDKLGAKIRRAQVEKIPYMLVVGDKEMEAKKVSPRTRDGKQLEPQEIEKFAEFLVGEARPPVV